MKHNFTFSAVVLLIAAGCGGAANKYDAVVTGTVTVDGVLAESGIVTFHPVDKGKVAIGRIHTDGSYSLRTGQGDLQEVDGGTVEPGDYIVTVSVTAPPAEGAQIAEGGPPIPGPSLIAAKYSSTQTSDLKRTVKPGPQVMILELEAAELWLPEEEEASSVEDASGTEPGEGVEASAAGSEENSTHQEEPSTEMQVGEKSSAEKSVENAQP